MTSLKFALALSLLVMPAQATEIFIDDVAGWEAALPGPYGRADFEAGPCGTGSVSENGLSATEQRDSWEDPFLCAQGGELHGSTWGDPLILDFDTPVRGALFDASYLQDGDIALWRGSGFQSRIAEYEWEDQDRVTFGVVLDQPVDRLYFASGDRFRLDSIRWKPVPEPSTALLLVLGLALLARPR